jgi:signal transduction histidine kinase
MQTKSMIAPENNELPPLLMREVLVEQLKWLNRLRMLAVAGIVCAGLICTTLFPVLESGMVFYVSGGFLLACNIVYALLLRRPRTRPKRRDIALAVVQIEIDSLILTILLHFSGGITNPFMLFYVFHIILATIILPRTLSFGVGISAIVMVGLMAVSELQGWLSHHPLLLSSLESLWQNPVYVLGEFVAFAATVVLVQYLTRTVIARMTAKEIEAARNHDVIQAIINAMTEGLLFITTEGKIAICNPAAQKWKETDGQQIMGNSLEHFPKVLAEHISRLLARPREIAIDTKTIEFYLNKSQRRYIAAKSSDVVGIDGSQLGYVIVGKDLTEQKELERTLVERTEETAEINEMLKRSRIEMTQREKMVAIGQMATGIAHEIGNPLASLSSVVQYVRRKTLSAEQDQQLALVEKQVERISQILKRMLSLSRPPTGEYKWTDINTVIDSTLTLIRYDKRAASVTVSYSPNSQLPMAWLNPQHLEQVFLNIFINALDAIAAQKTDEQHSLTVIAEYKEDMIEIRVTDTGVGISPEVCRRAFESFFTTKEIGKGTGLGLFISYNLLAEINGTIDLSSEPGKGTTVTIRIPIGTGPQKHLIGTDAENKDLPTV